MQIINDAVLPGIIKVKNAHFFGENKGKNIYHCTGENIIVATIFVVPKKDVFLVVPGSTV